eukprot:3021249-Amphidinium_carterae.1
MALKDHSSNSDRLKGYMWCTALILGLGVFSKAHGNRQVQPTSAFGLISRTFWGGDMEERT